MAVKITQLEKRRPRLKTNSQIPQNSKLGFLFPSAADFPSWTVSFSFRELVLSSLVICQASSSSLCPFLFPAPQTLCPFFLATAAPPPMPTPAHFMLCSCSSERKQSLNPNATISGGPCRKQIKLRRSTQHSAAERLPSEGNTSQLLGESRFWRVVFHPLQGEG